MNVETRIKRLEERAGVDKEIKFILVKNSIDGNPECPAFKGDTDTLCVRFKEFRRKPQVNETGFAVFWMECGGCEGVQA